MTETQKVKVNFQILSDTDDGLEELAKRTFRQKGAVIDWLVNEKFAQIRETEQESRYSQPNPAITIAEAEKANQ